MLKNAILDAKIYGMPKFDEILTKFDTAENEPEEVSRTGGPEWERHGACGGSRT